MSAVSRPIGDVPMRSIYPNFSAPNLTETTAPEAAEQEALAATDDVKPAAGQKNIMGWLVGLIALFVLISVLNIKV